MEEEWLVDQVWKLCCLRHMIDGFCFNIKENVSQDVGLKFPNNHCLRRRITLFTWRRHSISLADWLGLGFPVRGKAGRNVGNRAGNVAHSLIPGWTGLLVLDAQEPLYSRGTGTPPYSIFAWVPHCRSVHQTKCAAFSLKVRRTQYRF